MTSQQMMHSKCKPGYWFVNVAKVNEPQDWKVQPIPHKIESLFGYAPKVLLAKQYK